MKAIIVATGKDNVGIFSHIADFTAEVKLNIEDISQTLMQGYFVMIMMVSLETSPFSFKEIKDKLDEFSKKFNMPVRIQRTEIFDEMHSI